METQLIEQIKSVKGATFCSFTYRSASTGELARHTLGLNFDMERLYQEDLATVIEASKSLSGIALQAATEIAKSISESLEKGIGNNSNYTRRDTVINTAVRGLRLVLQKDGSTSLEVLGIQLQKKVLEKGAYKKVNSRELTIQKNKIRQTLKTSKIRTFRLNPENLQSVKINGETIEFD